MKNLRLTLLTALLIVTGSLTAIAQTAIYNSYPSAQATLFLDFDGHTVNGTQWNTNGPIVCGPSNLTAAQVTEVFNRIAEDYRPFNINVTTDEARYLAAPSNRRMRAVFTISNTWYSTNVGGIAYVGSFTWGDNTPCFIFTAPLNYNTKNIAEAGSHEAGHTFGLRHQSAYDANCVKTSDYSSGTGTGETAFAPIMGVGYYRNFTVWHNGSNPLGCNYIQNDLSILSNATNGFGFRTDDHSEVMGAATVASFSNNTFTVSGIVSKTDDRDLFSFTLPNDGKFKLNGIPYNVGTGNVGSNLDLQVDLINSANTVVGSYNPTSALSTVIDTTLSSGTYYLRIDGQGNQYASEYGSLGSYALEGTYQAFIVLPLRTLELKGVNENGQHKLNWKIDADEAIVKQVLESSTDGENFKPVTEASANARTHSYVPAAAAVTLYRLHVTFDNGRSYYSNTIALKNASNARPQLLNTVIRGNELIVTSPGAFEYIVSDFGGRTIAKGIIEKGSSPVYVNNLTSGAYLIKFSNGADQYVEKFVKQ